MPEEPKKKVTLSTAWREARELVWAHRRRLGLGMLLMLCSRAAGLVLPFSTKQFIDDVVVQKRGDLLLPLALKVGAATVVQAFTGFALSQVLGVAAQRAITEMRKSIEEHIARLPISYFDSTQTGVLISRIMTDAEGIRNLLGNGLVLLVGSSLTAIVALCVLFYRSWKLTLLTMLPLAIFAACMAFAFTRLRPIFRERGKVNAEVTGRLTQSLGGARVVKSYTAEKREDLVFAKGVHRLFRNVARTMTGISALDAFSTVISGGIGIIMILFGGRMLLSGEMTAGDALQYVSFTALLVMPVVQIASISTQISEAFAGLDRIREIKRMTTENEGDAARAPLAELKGDIVFENVSFEYNPGVPVLKGINFRAAPGTTTALVGSSGSGKSTVIGLVMAFHRPLSGKILVDGRDLSSIRLHDYRSHLGVVLQDNFLFDGTIGENISFARPHATMEQIVEAGSIAHCSEFIDGFEKKYATVVGERGIKLSGGQRQRVAIARAILADPRILILDEATSSLDSESEAMIQDGLRSLRRGRTTFVIAHRLSTIRSADQILVLEAGQIVERGTHDELMKLNGRYRELHDKQYKIESDRFVNPGEDFTPVAAEGRAK
jgi:subfamily B ATP-binding cassette protein MsbA